MDEPGSDQESGGRTNAAHGDHCEPKGMFAYLVVVEEGWGGEGGGCTGVYVCLFVCVCVCVCVCV